MTAKTKSPVTDQAKPAAGVTGRPKGAKTKPRGETEGKLTRCKCQSTNRTPYTKRRELEYAGIDQQTGQPFTHVVWRHTTCSDCGQARIDRHVENRPKKKRR